MSDAASAFEEISPAQARAVRRHDAASNYWDMTPVVMSILVGFLALRYISRGMGELELLVLSGVATAVFMGFKFFLYRMNR